MVELRLSPPCSAHPPEAVGLRPIICSGATGLCAIVCVRAVGLGPACGCPQLPACLHSRGTPLLLLPHIYSSSTRRSKKHLRQGAR